MSKPYKFIKSHPRFADEILQVSRTRFVNKIDKGNRPIGTRRITLAMIRHPSWSQIKKDLTTADFNMDDRAQFANMNIFSFIVVAFLATVLFGGLIYAMGLINSAFIDVGLNYDKMTSPTSPGYVNLTKAQQVTFGEVNDSIQSLRLVALALIFSLAIGIVISNALVRVYPAFFFVYVLIVIFAVIFSAPVSNAYLNVVNSNVYEGNLQSFTGANFILLHLPTFVTVMGILGGILMFINILRTGNDGSMG